MKKMRVAIFAPTGMLGNQVYKQLYNTYELVLLYRNKEYLSLLPDYLNHTAIYCNLAEAYEEYKKGFTKRSVLEEIFLQIGEVAAVINCMGITKPHSLVNPELTFFINGAFPHILSETYGEKLIQIATDCVFDANGNAPYTEEAAKLPADLYGLSKSLGEPYEKSLVLRTSIIGEELHGDTLLISWLKKQSKQSSYDKKNEIFGFTNHFWNGITTNQFAKICDEIISNRKKYPDHGLFHIFSNDVTKYELLYLLIEKYQLNIKIIKKETEIVDRRLRTTYKINEQLKIPTIKEMIINL